MKTKAVILSFLVGMIVLSFTYKYGRAESAASKASYKIGVVSVRKIFEGCKRNAKYRREAATEQDKIVAELDKLRADIEAEEAGLKTLKEGSSDYLAQFKEILQKRASFQAQQEFHKQQIGLKDQRWTEQLYGAILKHTGQVAKQKGLDIVFEEDTPELPTSSAEELMMLVRTHKVLYSDGCLDITEEVIAQLDASN